MFYSFSEFLNFKNIDLVNEHLDADPAKMSLVQLKSDGHRGTSADYKGETLLVFVSSYGGGKSSDLTYKSENSYRVEFKPRRTPQDMTSVEMVEMCMIGLLKFLIENKPNAVDISRMRQGMASYFNAFGDHEKTSVLDAPGKYDMELYNQPDNEKLHWNQPRDNKRAEIQTKALFNKRFDAGIRKVLFEASKGTGKRYKLSGSDLIVTPEGVAVAKAGGYDTDGVHITGKNLTPRSDAFKNANKQALSDLYANRRNTNAANAQDFENL
jgi:hypothetical protein